MGYQRRVHGGRGEQEDGALEIEDELPRCAFDFPDANQVEMDPGQTGIW